MVIYMSYLALSWASQAVQAGRVMVVWGQERQRGGWTARPALEETLSQVTINLAHQYRNQ